MTTLEIIGFVFGVAGVWLTIKENVWCFPVGLVNVIVSSFLFFEQRLYSDVLQQIVYVVLLSYGWYLWKKNSFEIQKETIYKSSVNENIKHQTSNIKHQTSIISTSSPTLLFRCIFAIAALTYIMGTVFKWYTDAAVPYWDALATSMSFTAQFLVARKKIENWLIWIDVNILYIGIYLYKELYLYALLFAIYLVMAVIGYFKWKKELQRNAAHD